MIRNAEKTDANRICDIYNHYVLNAHSTFETEPLNSSEMAKRFEKVQAELQLPWLVLEIDKEIKGYTYATQWKPRQAYSRTVESTIYLDSNESGKGYGAELYGALINQLDELEYHSILGGIALPNEESIALHERLGFVKVGQLKEVGYKFDRWVDVGYWELMLNR
ncbi:MAG: N-acetyltransferase family protein [Cyclobacteriaceae bacterium]